MSHAGTQRMVQGREGLGFVGVEFRQATLALEQWF